MSKIDNVNSRLDNIRDGVNEKLTVRRMSGMLTGAIVLGLVALFQLVTADFDFSVFLSVNFYFKIAYKIVLIFLVYKAAVNLMYDREYLKDRVQSARRKYIEMVKLKDLSFKEFLKEYNYNLKADAWCNSIDRKIDKYNRVMARGRFIKHLTKKVEKLETYKDEEYIKNNWHALAVKWNQVFYTDFNAEDSASGYNLRAREEFDRDVSRYSKKKAGTYILMACILSVLVFNFSLYNITTAMFWINLLIDLIVIVLRICDGALQTPKLIDLNFTNVYIYKTDIMMEYIAWMEKNGIENTKAFKIFNYIQKIEEQQAGDGKNLAGTPSKVS